MLRTEIRTEEPAALDALAEELERAGLVELRSEGGVVRYRTTLEGERVGRMLAMADPADAEAVLDALLDASQGAPRRH